MDEKDAKALLDTSAEKNRNLLIAFLLYLITVTVLVLSITDMDLLRGDKAVNLPLLGVDLPMIAFYIFLPALVLVLHFDLLQNSLEHRDKFKSWNNMQQLKAGLPASVQLFPFILDVSAMRYSALVERGIEPSWGGRLIGVAVWTLYVYFPPLVLALFLARFSDLQEPLVALYHLVVLVVDWWLIHLYWVRLYSPKLSSTWLEQNKSKALAIGALCLYVLTVLLFLGALQGLHYGWINQTSPLIKPIAFMAESENFEWVLPRISVPASYPYKVSEDDIRFNLWADEAAHAKENNYHANKLAVWENSSRPLNLRGRHLAFANLAGAQLRRVNLHDANLQGANLSKAQLQSADLRQTQLQGANLNYAQLESTNLEGAQLQGASLNSADLKEAILSTASLSWASIQDTNLRQAQLQGADMRRANLQVADLYGANLLGVDLQWSQLQGASFSHAQLQGANLSHAGLQGANLSDAKLQGANLQRAQVRGAEWKGADHQSMYAPHLDTQTKLDFGSRVFGLKYLNLPLLREAKKRQETSLAIPKPLGTADATVFAKDWLKLLCASVYDYWDSSWSVPVSAYYWDTGSDPSSGTSSYTTFLSDYDSNFNILLKKLNAWSMLAYTKPYTAITPAAIVEKLETSDCLPYADKVYKKYPILATTKAKAAKAPDQPAPTP